MDKEEWYGASRETDPSKPLMDDGTGTPMIIRWFDIHIPASVKEEQMVTNEELIWANKSKIIASAWTDGLTLVGELRCVEAEPRHYRIGGLFRARPGTVILEQTKQIQHANN